jgi:uncharacterized protein (TIGR02145 family)
LYLHTTIQTMRIALFLILMGLYACAFSQAPDLIPYQAAARNPEGLPLANTALNARFTLNHGSALGTAVWQELHETTTGLQGLFTVQLGSISSLAGVHWSNGPKFLHVEIDYGNGFIDMGTQQLVSVPYALHAKNILTEISNSGDTLFIGSNQHIIVPGISAANTDLSAHSCGLSSIHNESLTYGHMTDQEGNTYKTVTIGTQEWMAENLTSGIYRNGEAIVTGLTDAEWSAAGTNSLGAWSYLGNNTANDCPLGKLYNWYACTDARQLCPQGWHIPTDAEWHQLTTFLGSSALAGGRMKTTALWNAPNAGATNSSGFSGLPGSFRYSSGSYDIAGNVGYWWSSTSATIDAAWIRSLVFNNDDVNRDDLNKRSGFSVRCVHD